MKKLVATLSILGLTACQTNQGVPMMERNYTGTSPTKVYRAAEKVIKLSDPEDVVVNRKPNELVAWREYKSPLSWGKEHFIVTSSMQGGKTQVLLEIYDQGTANAPAYVGDGAFMPDTSGFTQYASAESYATFWERLEYALGKGNKWRSCEEIKAETPGYQIGLCGEYAEDKPYK